MRGSVVQYSTCSANGPISMPNVDSLIEFCGISKVYGQGDSEVRALDNVDFAIHAGEFVAVVGASGSGKSTCLNILGALDTPTIGSYRFAEQDVGALTLKQRARLRRERIGFIFQSFNLLGRTTAVENVELPLIYQRIPVKTRRSLAEAALERVGLADRIHHTPAELSGGQKQRVAIARALVAEPDVLLADEPTGNLDSASSEEVMQLIESLNTDQKLTVILVTHESEMAARAERSLCFRDGRIVEAVSKNEAAKSKGAKSEASRNEAPRSEARVS